MRRLDLQANGPLRCGPWDDDRSPSTRTRVATRWCLGVILLLSLMLGAVGVDNAAAATRASAPRAAIGQINPVVSTGPAIGVTSRYATLTGSVNPLGGQTSNCHFDWGTTTSYGRATDCNPQPGAGTDPVPLSATVFGVSPETTYHYRLVATNPGGTSYGSDQTFTTLPNPPVAMTSRATGLAPGKVTLNGSVNPTGSAISDCHFAWGLSSAYGQVVPCAQALGNGTTDVPVSANLQGLAAGKIYHYRLIATGPGGTVQGTDQTFTMPSPPSVITGQGFAQSSKGRLTGLVNPENWPVSDCHFDWGRTRSYGHRAACVPRVSTGNDPIQVHAIVTGLRRKTLYHYRLVATNAVGTTFGVDSAFRTGSSPEIVRLLRPSVSGTRVVFSAIVNPEGLPTLVYFRYGLIGRNGHTVVKERLTRGRMTVGTFTRTTVSVTVSLAPHTAYSVLAVAYNGAGRGRGSPRRFRTSTGRPRH